MAGIAPKNPRNELDKVVAGVSVSLLCFDCLCLSGNKPLRPLGWWFKGIVMKGSRPEQAVLTCDTDMSKTDETRRVIEGMVDGLNDHRIADIGEFFSQSFRWMGNQGCGTKQGLQAFQENWQKPFQAAFSDKVCIDEARLYMGEWAAAFGRQEAIHSGEFLGIKPTGKKVEIRYMDFWKVIDGKIVDNYVHVDFAYVAAQLGVDLFQGHGWEAYDRGEKAPPAPEDR